MKLGLDQSLAEHYFKVGQSVMAKRNAELGLGRGLDSLLGAPEVHSQGEGMVTVPVSQVEPGLNQPRKSFGAEALEDLAQSIREHGIIQPLTVRRLSSGYYQIIAGERRWRAAKLAGLDQVPVNIIEADERKVMELGLIENLQREDLNPIEEARGYRALMEEYCLNQEQIAQTMGKSRPAIANALRLLALPEDLLSQVESGSLSSGHARALLSLPSEDLRRQAARKVVDEGLSVRQTEGLCKALQRAKPPKQEEPPRRADGADDVSLYLEDLQKRLTQNLGRRVKIAHKGRKGRIELEYYDEEDLEELLKLLSALRGGGLNG